MLTIYITQQFHFITNMSKNTHIINAYENILEETVSKYKIRISTFLTSKKKTAFEEQLLAKFKEPFPIPFDGIVLSSYSEEGNSEFENSDTIYIKAINLAELLTTFVDASNDYYSDDWYGRNLRINQIKYLPEGKMILYLDEYENDYIDYTHISLYHALIKNEYGIALSFNNFNLWEGELIDIYIHNTLEPYLGVINFKNLMNLSEIEFKNQVKLLSSELKTLGLGYYPAKFSKDEYTFVSFEDNHLGLIDDLNEDTDFTLLGECLMNLYASRKRITCTLTEQETLQKIFSFINANEKNTCDSDNQIKDYLTQGFEEYKAKSYIPSATYNGTDFHFFVIDCNDKNIGDVILWHYEKIGNEVIIEYSLRCLTDDLIMKFQ
jgi:hypothetical protein